MIRVEIFKASGILLISYLLFTQVWHANYDRAFKYEKTQFVRKVNFCSRFPIFDFVPFIISDVIFPH